MQRCIRNPRRANEHLPPPGFSMFELRLHSALLIITIFMVREKVNDTGGPWLFARKDTKP